jgi:hypothetical protein
LRYHWTRGITGLDVTRTSKGYNFVKKNRTGRDSDGMQAFRSPTSCMRLSTERYLWLVGIMSVAVRAIHQSCRPAMFDVCNGMPKASSTPSYVDRECCVSVENFRQKTHSPRRKHTSCWKGCRHRCLLNIPTSRDVLLARSMRDSSTPIDGTSGTHEIPFQEYLLAHSSRRELAEYKPVDQVRFPRDPQLL